MPQLRDDTSNIDMLNAIRTDARSDYQNMVPEATKANIQDTIAGIMSDNITRNQFMNSLINRIGSTIVRDITWKNPLAVFKQGMMNFGDTIEEVHLDFIKPTIYEEQRDYLEKDIFGQAPPPSKSAFHTINRKEKFKITINRDVLRRAFLSDTGLAEMTSQIMAVAASSDEWSEFLSMTKLFKTYDEKYGFFRMQIADMNTFEPDKNKVDAALKALRVAANKMAYPTPAFNSAAVHSFARPEDLVLIATPEFKANVDVTSLSAAFNRSDAEAPSHIITVPGEALGMSDTSAILTSRQFLVIKDMLLENRSISNPEGLYDNFWLHHWSVLSASTFTPAIAFGTKPNTVVVTPKAETNAEIQAINILKNDGSASTVMPPGAIRQATITWKTAPANDHYATDWYIKNAKSRGTTISNDGVITIGNDETEGFPTVGVNVDTKGPGGTKPVNKEISIQVKK
nr:MAG TPA: Head protein [Caudoviricetes sp.]